jgi:hypothetical protein
VKDTGRARVPPRTRPFDAGQASVIAYRASQKQGLRILLYLYKSRVDISVATSRLRFCLFIGKYFFKINFRKVKYFFMFDSIMKNKLENIFQYLIMSWKMSWKITY